MCSMPSSTLALHRVGTRAVAEFFPEWSVWDDFVVKDMGRGLELDSLRSSHPVQVEMKSSSMVKEVGGQGTVHLSTAVPNQ